MITQGPSAGQLLANIIGKRAPKQDVLRGLLGDGTGVVQHPIYADHVYVRIKASGNLVVVARNLQVPVLNNVDVDVERSVDHSQIVYNVISLTEGSRYPLGTQPMKNVVLHAATHDRGGYDPLPFFAEGPYIANPVAITTSYTMLPADGYIGVTDTSALRTITLVPTNSIRQGRTVCVHCEVLLGSGITVAAAAGETVETLAAGPAASYSFSANYERRTWLNKGIGVWVLIA